MFFLGMQVQNWRPGRGFGSGSDDLGTREISGPWDMGRNIQMTGSTHTHKQIIHRKEYGLRASHALIHVLL